MTNNLHLHTYLPQDRRRALASGQTLPDRAQGSVLFADISGFTPFTEALRHAYGSRRGTEELSKHLNAVYTALIAEVERYSGSVTGFAGDAITCWFDNLDGSAPPRAVACAIALQTAMQSFAKISLPNGEIGQLTIKIGIATGGVRRLVVGDEEHYLLDVLTGETVNRTAVAEQLATAPEILLDEATAEALGDTLTLTEWRSSEETGGRFGLLGNFTAVVNPLPPAPLPELNEETTRPWLNPLIYEREKTGHPLLQTAFRPCVPLFIRFVGINYEADTAANQLNQFICPLQAILAHYEGTLIDLTFGDKGSYAYVNFGALSIHEDDARRAIKTALRLRELAQTLPFLEPLQMGITHGVIRTGAYGGLTRRQYGALGDEVNLAARLMSKAVVGELLVSKQVQRKTVAEFAFKSYAPVQFKGKAKPIPVFAVTSQQKRRAIHLQEPAYALPMVGRQAELQQIAQKLALAAGGKSQLIGIVAEAGFGKSRLVAEVIRVAYQNGFAGYGGACQSDAISTPYQAWKTVWGALFDVDHEMPLKKQMRFIEDEIKDRVPSRVAAMPLLNVVLDMNIPENEFTQNMEPKIRQSALHALLEDCLKAASKDEPLLIVIEDTHWIDALSHDLLEQLAKALANYPVCFVLAYRPPQMARLEVPRLEALAQFTKIELHELTVAEAESAIRAKLVQLYPAHSDSLPVGLVTTLMARTQGNPFYLEELLNYVRDRGLDPADIENIELPNSLHTLILSRIDQLSEMEKSTLRVASIIGRLFRARWLVGYYPELGNFSAVQASLNVLETLDITPLDSPEPELAYLFKHIVTHEVTYESLPFATRAKLHEQLARYLERAYPKALPLEALAFHYERSDNSAKQIEYLHKAGEAAQRNFANDAALDFYGKLLPLLALNTVEGFKEDKEKAKIHLKRGEVLERIGNFDEAESDYHAALQFGKDDPALTAYTQFALGKLNRQRGAYAPALEWLRQAQERRTQLEDKAGLAQVLMETGEVLFRKGEHAQARETLNKGLALAREAGDKLNAAQAFNNLGNVAWGQGDYATVRVLYEESLSLRREIDDKRGVAISLNNLGVLAFTQDDYATARTMNEESLSLRREIGDKRGIAISLNNLGLVTFAQGDNVTARAVHEEGLSLFREIGDKRGIAMSLTNLGVVALVQGDNATAWAMHEESLIMEREAGDKRGIAMSLANLGAVALAQDENVTAQAMYEESLTLCEGMADKSNEAYALLGLGLVGLAENKPEARENILKSLRLRVKMGEQRLQTSSLVGMAGLAVGTGDATGAAQILGAVASALKVLGAEVEFTVLYFHTQTVAAVQAQLGEAAFQSSWEEGEKWSLEEVVERALSA